MDEESLVVYTRTNPYGSATITVFELQKISIYPYQALSRSITENPISAIGEVMARPSARSTMN